MGYEYCSMNRKIYHDKLVDHQFIWCEYCNNACELLNERGFKSDLYKYIEHIEPYSSNFIHIPRRERRSHHQLNQWGSDP
jgi:hypothetical protein